MANRNSVVVSIWLKNTIDKQTLVLYHSNEQWNECLFLVIYMKQESTSKYADIIDVPYVKSVRHAHMAMEDRAAQFAPFAALTGHEDAAEQTAAAQLERMEYREVEEVWDV